MIKGVLILLGVYILYYGANIVYDLFLKKQKTTETDIAEEFSLEEVAEQQNAISKVNIEDVENVKMPDSFVTNGLHTEGQMIESARPDLEDLRNRFEAEQDMDEEIREAPIFQEAENHTQEEIEEPMTDDTVPTQKEQPEPKKNDWQKMLELSETSVQLVANYEGQKVYSII